ncbi:MAG TPA: right-handed parallel beta-helix repeat-containing protein [Dongiaceae bacterium]|nr:right-handed parallel beta-helix repeat-containing protein [Dongiaceae bacterium]
MKLRSVRRLLRATSVVSFVGLFLGFVFFAPTSHAIQSVPYQMNFQGRLNDSTGAPMANGTYNMKFRIYSASSGGAALWTEQRSAFSGTGVTVTTGGLFSVQLGAVTSLPSSIFNSASPLYLEVELPTPATATCSTSGCESYTEGAMTPRNQISSSPYAINSDLLDGLDSSAFATATGGNGYIQNQTAAAQAANFRINGTGSIQGSSTAAFQIQNAAGEAILTADTTANQTNVIGNLNLVQVFGPTTAPTATAGAAGSLTGTFNYTVTYVTASGETDGGPISSNVSVSAQQVNLTNIPVSASKSVTGRNIYRSLPSTSGPYYLVATINDNTTTSYTDNTASPGAILKSFNNTANLLQNSQPILQVDSSNFNLSLGTGALANNSTDSGSTSGSEGNYGIENTAVGNSSLSSNTIGDDNSAVGAFSLTNNTTGGFNSALGSASLKNNTTGSQNTGVGLSSLYWNTTGSNNTAVGYNAGAEDANQFFNTTATLQNATAIGAFAQVQANNTLVLGSVDLNTQTVIGATVPVGTNTFGVAPVDLNSASVIASQTSGSGTITASGAIFSAANVGEIFVWADGATETITGYTDSTHVTGSSTTITEAGQFFRTHRVGFQVTNTGTAYVQAASTTAFSVQNTAGSSIFSTDTTNNRVVVGTGSAGNTTGYLFILDSKTTSGDPAGVNGAMYYNGSMNAFRCYTNGAWANCAGGGGITSGNTASRPASPSTGTLYYDTTTAQLLQYNGTKWVGTQKTAVIVAASNSSQVQRDAADYVATGSNDGTTINTALTAATGGIVYLEPGTYTLGTTSVNIPDNTILSGGGDSTLLTYPNSVGAGTYYAITNSNTSTGTGVVVRDLKIDGNKTNQSAGLFYGVYFNHASNGTIENVLAQNMYSGYGLNLSNSSASNSVLDNVATGNVIGIAVYASNNTVTSNTASSNSNVGIDVSYTVSSNTISNNVTNSNTSVGIELYSSATNNTVTGNIVNSNGINGIYIQSSSANNNISANRLSNNGGGGTNDSLYVAGGNANQIVNNQITDTAGTGYAIHIASGVSTTYLADNTFSGTGATAISDAGTNTVYAGQMQTTTDAFIFRGSGNSSTAFAIQNAGGTNMLNVNTSTNTVTISGTLQATTALQATSLDTSSASTLTLGATNATGIALSQNTTIASGKTFLVQGGTTVKVTSTNAFSIQDASSNVYFNADTSTGTLTLGNAASGNYITFAPSTGLTAFGTTQHTKTISLSAEYAGAVLYGGDTGGANCSTNQSGTMTSGYDTSSAQQSYYNWTSTSATSQCYDVVVRIPIPNDFSSWSGAPSIKVKTDNAANTAYAIGIIKSDGVTYDASYGSAYTSPGTLGTSWANMATSSLDASGYTAGGYMTILVRLTAKSSSNVQLADIVLTYNSKF